MMNKSILYVPGLHDTAFFNRILVKFLPFIWRMYGLDVHIIFPKWSSGKEFSPKLQLIVDTIDEFAKKGDPIYLFGQSAGGSAVLNAFSLRKNKVKKVVNICGRLRRGSNVFPSLELAAKGNPAFMESVLLFENQNEKKLTEKDREKILTIKPLFDEIVPSSTVSLEKATNITIPVILHSLGGIMALTVFAAKIASIID